jgi:geranylgeranyl diphosphate synthase type II
MITLKTAVLLAASLEIGAIIANASPQDAQYMYDYGKNIGVAFQLQDDILDVYAQQADFGKQVAGDIVSNKKTILMLKAFEQANEQQKVSLSELLNETNPHTKIQGVMKVYEDLQVKSKAEDIMNAYFQKADDILDKTSLKLESKEILRAFSNALKNRIS